MDTDPDRQALDRCRSGSASGSSEMMPIRPDPYPHHWLDLETRLVLAGMSHFARSDPQPTCIDGYNTLMYEKSLIGFQAS